MIVEGYVNVLYFVAVFWQKQLIIIAFVRPSEVTAINQVYHFLASARTTLEGGLKGH